MIRIHPYRGSRSGLMARRLALLALPAVLMLGCNGDDGGDDGNAATPTSPPAATSTATATAVPTTATPLATATRSATGPPATATPTTPPTPATPTMPPNANAGAACAKLAGCDQCFSNAAGRCISNDACAARLSADVAICLNAVSGCDQRALGDCLFPGCDGNDPTGECE